MEAKKEVKTYLVKYMCDECGEEMKSCVTYNLMTDPPINIHRCKNGHEKQFAGVVYPRIEYEEVK